jgi:hypothetical protein
MPHRYGGNTTFLIVTCANFAFCGWDPAVSLVGKESRLVSLKVALTLLLSTTPF